MRKSVNIFSLRAMCWYHASLGPSPRWEGPGDEANHDSTERVLGSKSLENELLWTSVNVLVVSPVIQRLNNCMCMCYE